MATVDNDVWEFHDPGSVVILPLEGLGGTWVMDTLAGVTAEVVAQDTLVQFGLEDVQRTIHCSNGNEWVISREWGVMRMNTFVLRGVQGPDVGSLVPSLEEMYPYQPGDIMQLRSGGGGPSYNGWYPYGSTSLRTKLTIWERIVLEDEIQFDTWAIKWRRTTLPEGSTGSNTWNDYSAEEAPWSTSGMELPYRDLLFSYPGELITSEHQITQGSPHFDCIARHTIDPLGRYCMECDLLVSSLCTGTNTVRYVEGIGIESYGWYCTGRSESYTLEGAIINGDTVGTVSPDEYFLSIDDIEGGAINVFPNPTSDLLTVQNLDPDASSLVLYDAQGRVVLQRRASCPTVTLDVSRLGPGIYSLSDLIDPPAVRMKVMIVR
jgi:hypothetical protein